MPPRAYEIRRDDIPDLLHVMKRFWDYVDMTGECWLWTGGTFTRPEGVGRYGRFWVGKQQFVAHRFLWAMLHGSVSPNLYVLHRCDQTLCVRPSCLWLGTQGDNMLDMMKKGRHPVNGASGEENASTRVPAADVQQVFELYALGYTQTEIGARLGLSQTHIGRILRREARSDVTVPEGRSYRPLKKPTDDAIVRATRDLAKKGWTYRAIADRLGLPYETAWAIATGRSRAAVPDIAPE